jgi:hypothetical protein
MCSLVPSDWQKRHSTAFYAPMIEKSEEDDDLLRVRELYYPTLLS